MLKGVITINVSLEGLTPILFDRYSGDNKTQLEPQDKLYRDEKDGLCLPSENLKSFLSAENTTSIAKRFLDSREYRKVSQAFGSYISVEPFRIPLVRPGKKKGEWEQIRWEGWNKNGITIHESVARLKGGIPNPKVRPMVALPWSLNFKLLVIENDEFPMNLLESLVRKGGIAIGLGTFRGTYGKFDVVKWQIEGEK